MSKVTSIELKNDKNGNPMKVVMFEDTKVYVNSKYDVLIYDKVVEGSEWELVKDGDFTKIKYEKPASSRPTNIGGAVKAAELTAQSVEKAQRVNKDTYRTSAIFRDANTFVATFFTDIDSLPDNEKAMVIAEKVSEMQKLLSEKYDNLELGF